MNNVIPLQIHQNASPCYPLRRGDFATALSLRRMATSTGATPAYLLASEVSALLFYMPDQRHHMLFAPSGIPECVLAKPGWSKTVCADPVRKSACATRTPATKMKCAGFR